jgi:hypothetical protein
MDVLTTPGTHIPISPTKHPVHIIALPQVPAESTPTVFMHGPRDLSMLVWTHTIHGAPSIIATTLVHHVIPLAFIQSHKTHGPAYITTIMGIIRVPCNMYVGNTVHH